MIETGNFVQSLGLLSSVILPFFNIPLMIRMIKRRSSEDLSLVWVMGVFICLLGMQPAAWLSQDFVFKIFSITNLVLFSGVVFLTIFFRLYRAK